MKIFSRNRQIKTLEEVFQSKSSEFLAVYGRRRVGKTYLIKNYFEEKGVFFHITGTPKETASQQLANFAHVFTEVFNRGDSISVPGSWQDAFHLLREAVKKAEKGRRIIFFFDELPWLATNKSGFLPALTYLWNRYLVSDARVILVVCGSAASWMINNLINAKGGLYNRITRLIRLQPFNLPETDGYLRGKGITLSRAGVAELYMALGGVAAYLDMAGPGMSPAQVIADKIFNPDSLLYGEFERLFKSLFSKSEIHMRVIKELMRKREGMDREELFGKAGIKSGSVRSRIRNELVESGFIAEMPVFGNRKRGSVLRIIDEYTIFYLKWQKEIKNSRVPPRPEQWLVMQNSASWKSWSGYAFESLCHNHVHQIASALGIGGIIHSWSSWRRVPAQGDGKGVQVDMVIDRSDNCINLCELKFQAGTFSMTGDYADQLLYKRQKFIEVTGTRKTVFITLITGAGAKENMHYLRAVNNQLTLEDLFLGG